MKICVDLITGADIISESYQWVSLFDSAACEIQSKKVDGFDE